MRYSEHAPRGASDSVTDFCLQLRMDTENSLHVDDGSFQRDDALILDEPSLIAVPLVHLSIKIAGIVATNMHFDHAGRIVVTGGIFRRVDTTYRALAYTPQIAMGAFSNGRSCGQVQMNAYVRCETASHGADVLSALSAVHIYLKYRVTTAFGAAPEVLGSCRF